MKRRVVAGEATVTEKRDPSMDSTSTSSPSSSISDKKTKKSKASSVVISYLLGYGIHAVVLSVSLYWFFRGLTPILMGYPNGPVPHFNDVAFHSALTSRMMDGGPNAWVPQWGSGAAVLRYYQNFPHLQAAIFASLFGVAPETGVVWVNALYMAVWPFALFWCIRKLGFSRLSGAYSVVLITLVDADKGADFKHLFGLQMRCFTWDGWGLYTQIVSAVWMCVALGQSHEFLTSGKGFALAAASIALTWLSHLIVGYGVSLLVGVIVVAQSPSSYKMGVSRFIALNGVAAFSIAYQVIPTLLEESILNRSVFEPAAYWDSYGFWNVLRYFWEGRLLDCPQESFPWMTYIVMSGLAYALVSGRQVMHNAALRQMLLCFFAALFLFAGRHTFGPLVHLMPFSHNLPFHRFFVHFHLFSLILGGWVMAEAHGRVVSLVAARVKPAGDDSGTNNPAVLFFPLVTLLLFVPVVAFPSYARTRVHWGELALQHKDNQEWWGQAAKRMLELVDTQRQTKPGRAYAGARWNWGTTLDVKFMKWYAIWTSRGHQINNIGFMWHAMGHMSEMDFYFNDTRQDHYTLFNVRYVVGNILWNIPPGKEILGEVVSNHAVQAVPSAKGYFSLVHLHGCYDAWKESKDAAWNWRKDFVLSANGHSRGRFPRVALTSNVRCADDELQSPPLTNREVRGTISQDQGNDDIFRATIDCEESAGCVVLLRVSYHPHFVVRNLFTRESYSTMTLAPSYIGFRVPHGQATYIVEFVTPLWSKFLWLICYLWLACAILVGVTGVSLNGGIAWTQIWEALRD